MQVAFTDRGEGPAVILGHSFLCSGEMWAPQLPALEAAHRVVNVDFRGHGASSPPPGRFSLYDLVDDLRAVLDHLGIERAAWAGLSIGGMVALRAALTAPERVSALVVLDSHAGAERTAKKIKYGAMGLGTRLVGVRPFLWSVLPLFFSPTTRERRPELVAEYAERFAAMHVPSLLRTLRALMRRDSVVDRLPSIAAPTLVVVGADDASLPPPDSREIADGIPGAELLVVPEAGHLSNLERPDVVTPAMVEFLGTRAR